MNSLDLLNKNSKFRLDLDKELGNIDTESLSEEQNIKTSQNTEKSLENNFITPSLSKRAYTPLENLFKSIKKAEKKIEKIENCIKKTPKVKPNNSLQLLNELKNKLVLERQNNYSLQKENEKLKKKISYKANLATDISSLKDDYNNLIDSFKRSEDIRKKQKRLIGDLKGELLSLDKNQGFYKSYSKKR